MPWFRVDDTFAFHGKTVAAGNAALGLWVRAGSWSAQTLTGGKIPDHMIAAFGSVKAANLLIQAGLWERIEGGYLFHDWDKYQPAKESVEAEREAARERQRRAREKSKLLKSQRDDNTVSQGTNGVSHAVTDPLVTVPPSLPIPTQPLKDVDAAQKRAANTGKRLPKDWLPDPEVREQMAEERPDVDLKAEHRKFVDHWQAKTGKDATKLDWNATWRNWIRNVRAVGPPARPVQPIPSYAPTPAADPDSLPWREATR